MRLTVAVLLLPALGCVGQPPTSSSTSAVTSTDSATSALKICPRAAATRGVFTLNDDATANAVLAYDRDDDGTLTPVGVFFTGGTGSGAGEKTLKSQGALTLSTDHQYLFAVNAGSNDVSSFHVNGSTLTLVSRISSGGRLPVSVTEYEGLVYVLNAGDSGNISGFRVDRKGRLSAIAGSTQALSTSAAAAAQVSFDPWGMSLVVSEKATQTLSVYTVDSKGVAAVASPLRSAGSTPFGFAFTGRGVLAVSEASGGAAGASAVSSYAASPGKGLQVITPSLGDGQTGACWLAATHDGRFAYVTNTGSSDISSYAIADNGSLTLQNAYAATLQGGLPLDMAVTSRDGLLYVLDSANHSIVGLHVEADGSLTSLGALATGLPPGAVGLAAR